MKYNTPDRSFLQDHPLFHWLQYFHGIPAEMIPGKMRIAFLLLLFWLMTASLSAQIISNRDREIAQGRKGMLAMYGGLSVMMSLDQRSIGQGYDDMPPLRTGSHVGLEGAFFTPANVGLGFRASRFDMRQEGLMFVDRYAPANIVRPIMQERIRVYYIGPGIFARMLSSSGNLMVLFDLSIGTMFYTNNARIPEPIGFTGQATGFMYGVRIDRRLNDTFSLNIGFTHLFGQLRDVEMDDGRTRRIIPLPGPEHEDLTRIDLSLGLRWNW